VYVGGGACMQHVCHHARTSLACARLTTLAAAWLWGAKSKQAVLQTWRGQLNAVLGISPSAHVLMPPLTTQPHHHHHTHTTLLLPPSLQHVEGGSQCFTGPAGVVVMEVHHAHMCRPSISSLAPIPWPCAG
jgi:hypothetical protein